MWSSIVFGMSVIIYLDSHGYPRRMGTAVFGMIGPFVPVALAFRRRWDKFSFWKSFLLCFLMHAILLWVLFMYVFGRGWAPGWGLWSPVAFVEVFVLLAVVKRVEDLITGKREIIRL